MRKPRAGFRDAEIDDFVRDARAAVEDGSGLLVLPQFLSTAAALGSH